MKIIKTELAENQLRKFIVKIMSLVELTPDEFDKAAEDFEIPESLITHIFDDNGIERNILLWLVQYYGDFKGHAVPNTVKLMKFLIEHGADYHVVDKNQKTLLEIASKKGNASFVTLFKELNISERKKRIFKELVDHMRYEMKIIIKYPPEDSKTRIKFLKELIEAESLDKLFAVVVNYRAGYIITSEALKYLLSTNPAVFVESLPREYMLAVTNELIAINGFAVARLLLSILNLSSDEIIPIVRRALSSHCPLERLMQLRDTLSINAFAVLRDGFQTTRFGDNIIKDTLLTLDAPLLRYMVETAEIIPAQDHISDFFKTLAMEYDYGKLTSCQFNQSVSNENRLAGYAYLNCFLVNDHEVNKMYSDVASQPLAALPDDYLFRLFEELTLKYPKTCDEKPFGAIQQIIADEIVKRQLPLARLLEIARQIPSAIMFYVCACGRGYTYHETIELLGNPDLFDGNHAYHQNIRPLHLLLHYKKFALIDCIIKLGGDPDATCQISHYKTPICKKRVDIGEDPSYFMQLVNGAKSVSNSLLQCINDNDDVVMTTLMTKIHGDISQINMDDKAILPWLLSGRTQMINIFNFMALCNEKSYAKLISLINKSEDIDLKEMIIMVDSYNRDKVIPAKLLRYVELQKNNAFLRPMMGGFSFFSSDGNRYPCFATFNPEDYAHIKPGM